MLDNFILISSMSLELKIRFNLGLHNRILIEIKWFECYFFMG